MNAGREDWQREVENSGELLITRKLYVKSSSMNKFANRGALIE